MTGTFRESVEEATTARFCGQCGSPIPPESAYCGECGTGAIEAANGAAGDAASPSARPTVADSQYGRRTPLVPPVTPTEQVPPPANYGTPVGGAAPTTPAGGPPAVPPAYVYPTAYPVPQPPSGKNTSLLLSLVIAIVLAVGAIVAVVLVASGKNNHGVTVSNAAGTKAPAAVPPSGGGGNDAGTAVKPSGLVAPAAQGAAPTSHPRPDASPGASASGAAAAVQRHWDLINQGDYDGAFALFTPDYQGRIGHDSWVSAKKMDRPAVSNLVVGTPTSSDATSANVPVLSLHTVGQEAPPCHNWSGSYDMKLINGSWLIDQSNLNSTTC